MPIKKPKTKKAKKAVVKREMSRFKAGKLHSGSKKGPIVTNPKQAVAISLSSAGVKKKNKKRMKKRKVK